MAENRGADSRDIYQIRVRGLLDQRWADWFAGFKMEYIGKDTILSGPVADQAALHGILAKIRDLGLAIEFVQREGPQPRSKD